MAFDITTFTHVSGKTTVTFDCTAVNGTELLINKESTIADLYIEHVQLMCGSGALAGIYDGSGGSAIIGHFGSGCQASVSGMWDWRTDPLKMGSDSTALCISGSADGIVQGTVKVMKG